MSSRIFSRALIFFLSLISASFAAYGGGGGVGTVELWCVAKNNAEDAALQSALDWACGAGGADCRPILNNGPCYDSSDIQRTASYAFNDYFLKHGLTEDSCNFSNNAALTSLNPSYSNCKFPSRLCIVLMRSAYDTVVHVDMEKLRTVDRFIIEDNFYSSVSFSFFPYALPPKQTSIRGCTREEDRTAKIIFNIHIPLSTSNVGVSGSITAGKANEDLTSSHSIIHRLHRGLFTLSLFFGIILIF